MKTTSTVEAGSVFMRLSKPKLKSDQSKGEKLEIQIYN